MYDDGSFGLAMAFAYTLTWAATGVVLRTLADRLDPFLIVGVRAAIGTVLIVPLALVLAPEQFQLIDGRRLAYLVGSVLIGGIIGSVCNVYSLRLLGMGRSFPLTNASPLFTFLFGFLLLGEPVLWTQLLGASVTLVGVYLISRPGRRSIHQTEERLTTRTRIIGVSLALTAAVTWGLGGVVLALGVEGISSIVASSVRLPVVALMALLIAGARRRMGGLWRIDRQTALLLLLVGTVGYAGVSTLWVTSVQHAGPALTATIGATAPMFALPLSIVLLHERPTRATLVGTALTVIGILIVV